MADPSKKILVLVVIDSISMVVNKLKVFAEVEFKLQVFTGVFPGNVLPITVGGVAFCPEMQRLLPDVPGKDN